MKVLLEKEEFLKNTIRDCLAINPMASIKRMQELVEQRTGRPISDKYLSKLRHKVRREAVIRSDRKRLNERLSEVRERYRMYIEALNRTAYWRQSFMEEYGLRQPKLKDQMGAMKLAAKMDLDLLKAEYDIGMYEDKREAIGDMLKQGVLPTELHEQVIGVFRTWKLAPDKPRDIVDIRVAQS